MSRTMMKVLDYTNCSISMIALDEPVAIMRIDGYVLMIVEAIRETNLPPKKGPTEIVYGCIRDDALPVENATKLLERVLIWSLTVPITLQVAMAQFLKRATYPGITEEARSIKLWME